MSKTSRMRFRPTWMGRFNVMRDQYAAGQKQAREFDAWYAEISDAENPFAHRECTARHASAPLPRRPDFDTDEGFADAVAEWLRLGTEAARCHVCTADPPNGLGHGESAA